MSAMKGILTKVWAGLKETHQGRETARGWQHQGAVNLLGAKGVLLGAGGGHFLELSAQLPIKSLEREQSHHLAGRELAE